MIEFPRIQNGHVDTGKGLTLMDGKLPRCPNCSSTNYIETLSLELCNDCGLECDYWGAGANDVYNEWQAKQYIDSTKEQEKVLQYMRDESQFWNEDE